MEFGEMKRNTSNWSNFCMLSRRAGLSASAGFSCLISVRYRIIALKWPLKTTCSLLASCSAVLSCFRCEMNIGQITTRVVEDMASLSNRNINIGHWGDQCHKLQTPFLSAILFMSLRHSSFGCVTATFKADTHYPFERAVWTARSNGPFSPQNAEFKAFVCQY